MAPAVSVSANVSHTNPVYPGYFADPFVWQHEGIYYAVGTGAREATGQTVGNIFPLLRSGDFFNWESVGQALVPPAPVFGNTFWAPAVAWESGLLYLYYSVGFGDKHHQLRVAMSKGPLGPYTDADKVLLDPQSCPFAIDPHPFRDDDGQWYMFYARDFLDCANAARPGTALMLARMKTMTELEGEGQPVLRARSDWQRFEANRPIYGEIWDWHTLEGPCPWKHDGRHYCFYSGGRWENDTYGVDFGVADSILGPYSDVGNERGPRVLRTLRPQLIGPGHNSIVVGPDGRTEYLVFHAWDKGMRVRQMHIARLLWTPEGPRCAVMMAAD